MSGFNGMGPKEEGPRTGRRGQYGGVCPRCRRCVNCPVNDCPTNLDEEEEILKKRLEEIQKEKDEKKAS